MLQKIIFAASLATGIAGSQFPEFSQQYLQRLGGQYDALSQIAADFDASATRAGLTRADALAQIKGSTFQDAHREDMARAFARLDKVTADLALLRAASPLERMALPHRFRDGETFAATWADFRPAVPVSLEGAYATAIGFLAGLLGLNGLAAALRWPFRRRRSIAFSADSEKTSNL
jgi:hypothetical protein